MSTNLRLSVEHPFSTVNNIVETYQFIKAGEKIEYITR